MTAPSGPGSVGTVHVVGAGLAGLSAAVTLARGGHRAVCLYEASNHAGGRARTYFDSALDCEIDNGNHLALSANDAILDYLSATDASDSLAGPSDAQFPFVDLDTGDTWTLKPNRGRIPWWIFSRSRRVPGTGPGAYLAGIRLVTAGPDETVADCLDTGSVLFRRLWEPLAIGVLNAAAEEGAARLLGRVARETLGRGGRYCRPLIARKGLSHSLVDPALTVLDAAGIFPRYGSRLRALPRQAGRVEQLDFTSGPVTLPPDDRVILALPAAVTAELLPEVSTPIGTRAIVNAHFRLDSPVAARLRHGQVEPSIGFVGVVGSPAQWLFIRDDLVSVTVSAADDLAAETADAIAARLWPDVAAALSLCGLPLSRSTPMPTWRIVKEKRATFLQTPQAVARRPGTRTAWANLLLAGDWTDTGLPATMEGAIRSGRAAAETVLQARSKAA